MNLAGVSSGTIETRWRGSPRSAETEITIEVAPPERVSPQQLPLNARGHAIYRTATAELEVSEFNANTRASQVRASGTLSTRAAMKVSVSTSDLGEWERALISLGYRQHGIPSICEAGLRLSGLPAGGCRKSILRANCNRRISKS